MPSAPHRPSFDNHRPVPRSTERPASTKAAAFWESLRDDMITALAELAALDASAVARFAIPAEPEYLDAATCSADIDTMRADLPEIRGLVREARRAGARSTARAIAGALEPDRLYEVDGEIYRTVLSGAGNLYAKIWTTDGWDYAAGAIRYIRPEHRMSIERAKELSIKFARCIRCGAALTADKSVEQGIGPICITKI
jgi:Family of unknown function (DUF6011)